MTFREPSGYWEADYGERSSFCRWCQHREEDCDCEYFVDEESNAPVCEDCECPKDECHCRCTRRCNLCHSERLEGEDDGVDVGGQWGEDEQGATR